MKNPYPKTYRSGIPGIGMVDNPAHKAWGRATAANNAEWVAWGKSKCTHPQWQISNYGFEIPDPVHKHDCPICWQERKKSMEVDHDRGIK